MACTGPFVNGVSGGSVCGCSCPDSKCCPPPCCTSITLTFELGPAYNEETNPEGCKCEDPTPSPSPSPTPSPSPSAPGYRAIDFENADWDTAEKENWETVNIGTHLIPFPKFMHKNKQKANDDNFVFALNASCSLPCELVEVTLETDGCCLEIVDGTNGQTNFGPDVVIRMVGDGFLFPTAAVGTCKFDLVVNGTTITEEVDSIELLDGEEITVEIIPTGDGAGCCDPCWVDTQCTPKNLLSSKIFYRARSVKRGSKGYLNITKLKQKIEKLKRRKS